MRLILAVVMAVSPILACTTATRAEPRSAKDCAGIEESFAYNECIAKFGPSGAGKIVSHTPGVVIANTPPSVPVDMPPLADTPSPRVDVPARVVAPRKVVGSIYQRHANGRYFAVFQIGRSAPPAYRTSAAATVNTAPGAAKGKASAFVSRKATAAYSARGRQYRRR